MGGSTAGTNIYYSSLADRIHQRSTKSATCLKVCKQHAASTGTPWRLGAGGIIRRPWEAAEGEATHIQKCRFRAEFGKLKYTNFGVDMCLTLMNLISRLISPFVVVKIDCFQFQCETRVLSLANWVGVENR
jgi:hypothetical protein